MPATYTAVGTAPAYILDSTSHTNVDWQLITGTGPLRVEANVLGGGWSSTFRFGGPSTAEHRSFRDIVIERSTSPALILDDTSTTASISFDGTDLVADTDVKISKATPEVILKDTGGYDYTLRANSDKFELKVDTGSTANVLESNGTYMYAPKGLVSGDDTGSGAAHVLKWKRFTGHLGSTGTITVDTGVASKVIGALVMLSNDSNEDSANFDVYDFRYDATSPHPSFYVRVDRTGSGTTDEVIVTFNTGTYTNANGWYEVIAFYKP